MGPRTYLGTSLSGTSALRLAVAGAMATVGLLTAPQYPGDTALYLVFNASCIFLAITAISGPVAHGFSALALFLVLGFWIKAVAKTMGLNPLIEPVGAFVASGRAWDEVLLLSTTGLTAVALAKIVWSLPARAFIAPHTQRGAERIPNWFIHHRRLVWLVIAASVVAGTLANAVWRFHMVGVAERLVLPFHLNVAINWWLISASSICIALLLGWERQIGGGQRLGMWLLVPIAEALLSTVIMLSRGYYLMKTLPYALVFAHSRLRRAMNVRWRTLAMLTVAATLGFGISLAGASWLRIRIYPPMQFGAQSRGTVSKITPKEVTTYQLTTMILGRWIGLEGMLAVSSYPGRSVDLWARAAVEDPSVGNAAIYQKISRSHYKPQEGFKFLTLPGLLAVMAYAGSRWFLFISVLVVSLLLLVTEDAYRRLFGNEFLCAVVGVTAANTVAQLNFPYLAAVLFIEIWCTLGLLWYVTRAARREFAGSRPMMAGAAR